MIEKSEEIIKTETTYECETCGTKHKEPDFIDKCEICGCEICSECADEIAYVNYSIDIPYEEFYLDVKNEEENLKKAKQYHCVTLEPRGNSIVICKQCYEKIRKQFDQYKLYNDIKIYNTKKLKSQIDEVEKLKDNYLDALITLKKKFDETKKEYIEIIKNQLK